MTSAQCGVKLSTKESLQALSISAHQFPGHHDLCDSLAAVGGDRGGALASLTYHINRDLPVDGVARAGGNGGQSGGGVRDVALDSFLTQISSNNFQNQLI